MLRGSEGWPIYLADMKKHLKGENLNESEKKSLKDIYKDAKKKGWVTPSQFYTSCQLLDKAEKKKAEEGDDKTEKGNFPES